MGLFLLIATIVALFLLVRQVLLAERKPARPGKPGRLKDQGAMVRCEHCGMHIPQHEAYHYKKKMYCGKEHALADAKKPEE